MSYWPQNGIIVAISPKRNNFARRNSQFSNPPNFSAKVEVKTTRIHKICGITRFLKKDLLIWLTFVNFAQAKLFGPRTWNGYKSNLFKAIF